MVLFFFLLTACGNQNEKEAAEFFKRGVHLYKKNEFDEALRFFQEAVSKNPNLADGYNNIGLIYEEKKDYPQALANYDKAIEIDENFTNAKFNKARLLGLLNEPSVSLEIFKELEGEYADSANYYNERGQVFAQTNDMSAAAADFEKAIQLNPGYSSAWTNRGYVFFEENNLPEARRCFEKAISLDSTQATPYSNLSVILTENGETAAAIKAAQRAVQLERGNDTFKNNLAFAFLTAQKNEEGQKILTKIWSRMETNPYFQRNQGIYEFNEKKFAKALNFFEQAEKNDPGTRMIYYYLGKTYRQLGDSGKAKKMFERGVALNDGHSAQEL